MKPILDIEETICALATAPGGALGIIRISGRDTFSCLEKIFRPAGPKPLVERQDHEAVFGTVCRDSQVIDEAVLTLFRGPHSYTGEDSAELSCHGSPYILQQVLELLIQHGCRMAHPGEYTQRAFLNGRMDLSQAEAVADLIASQTAASHRIAMNQLRGSISQELRGLRDQLMHITSLLELELDFGDHEELEFADRTELRSLCQKIIAHLTRLVKSYRTGNAIKNGVPVAIIGPTNAGKSTLLNALLHEERAIVSDIHGTTRDTIEDVVVLGGVMFRFIDTAGLRETTDQIESLGIKRSYQMIDRADIVLLLTAPDSPLSADELQKIKNRCEGKTLIRIANKADLTVGADEQNSTGEETDKISCTSIIPISAKHGMGIPELEERLVRIISSRASEEQQLISNARHYQALKAGLETMNRVQEGLDQDLPGDLVSQDLREALQQIAEVTGNEISSDEVLGNIFKQFCIGK